MWVVSLKRKHLISNYLVPFSILHHQRKGSAAHVVHTFPKAQKFQQEKKTEFVFVLLEIFIAAHLLSHLPVIF